MTLVASFTRLHLLSPLRRVALRGLCVALPKALTDVIAASPVTAIALGRAMHMSSLTNPR